MALQPTQAEVGRIVDLPTILEWAGMSAVAPTAAAAGSGSVPNPVSSPPATESAPTVVPATPPALLMSDVQSFVAWFGGSPIAHYRQLAVISQPDFRQELLGTNGWKLPGGASPSLAQRGQATVAHATARCLCDLDPWPAAQATAQAALQANSLPPAAPSAVLPTGLGGGTSLLNVPTIKLGAVLDQKLGEDITYLPDPEIQACNARYYLVMDEMPPKEVAVTTEQLAGLRHVLDTCRPPYADFAVFGPHGVRSAKRAKMAGQAIDSAGNFHMIEMYGPNCIASWQGCYDVLTTALIMLKKVRRKNLRRYRVLITKYAMTYGFTVWHLLYQADVRMRQEHMPRLRIQALEDNARELAANRPALFDIDSIWNHVWEMALADEQFWKWELEHPAMMVLARVQGLSSLVAGDAAVGALPAPLAIAGVPATVELPPSSVGRAAQPGAYQPPPAARDPPSQKRKVKKNQHNVSATGSMTTNRGGAPLCSGFQDGSCTWTVAGNRCGYDSSKMHQCARCLHPKHGAHSPAECTAPPASAKGGKGRGKGKGKGKGRSQY